MEDYIKFNQTIITLIQGDITKVTADVIVNAANTSLLGGGGVDGAIHKAGGKSILEECVKIRERQGGCAVGEAVITTAGNLPASHVIHTVGPVWNGGNKNEIEKLKSCYRNSLSLASEYKAKSIAFPNISTGIYRFPKQLAAETALEAVFDYLNPVSVEQATIEKIYFACFDDENFNIYRNKLLNAL
ncbi:O-acetyl-ADP-ribose deacetylase [Paenibacillus humicola]|uniref:O-acetyl-ADP-ribose deacetylase n=1 Tax=Paenibacillus humicola TaxID=3110540 RepID=UPI00237BE56A|nr:O-acetyl-ADP-ribose deacetylase [Paenibacillus humicola]